MEKINNEKVKINMEFGYQMMILEVLLDEFKYDYERSIDISLDDFGYTAEYTIKWPISLYHRYDEFKYSWTREYRIRIIILSEIEAFAKNWSQSYVTHKKGFFINKSEENIKSLGYIKNELSEFVSYLEDALKGCRPTTNEDLLEFKESIQTITKDDLRINKINNVLK